MEQQTPEYWIRLGAEIASKTVEAAVQAGVSAAMRLIAEQRGGGVNSHSIVSTTEADTPAPVGVGVRDDSDVAGPAVRIEDAADPIEAAALEMGLDRDVVGRRAIRLARALIPAIDSAVAKFQGALSPNAMLKHMVGDLEALLRLALNVERRISDEASNALVAYSQILDIDFRAYRRARLGAGLFAVPKKADEAFKGDLELATELIKAAFGTRFGAEDAVPQSLVTSEDVRLAARSENPVSAAKPVALQLRLKQMDAEYASALISTIEIDDLPALRAMVLCGPGSKFDTIERCLGRGNLDWRSLFDHINDWELAPLEADERFVIYDDVDNELRAFFLEETGTALAQALSKVLAQTVELGPVRAVFDSVARSISVTPLDASPIAEFAVVGSRGSAPKPPRPVELETVPAEPPALTEALVQSASEPEPEQAPAPTVVEPEVPPPTGTEPVNQATEAAGQQEAPPAATKAKGANRAKRAKKDQPPVEAKEETRAAIPAWERHPPSEATGAVELTAAQAKKIVDGFPEDVLYDLEGLLHAGAGANRGTLLAVLGRNFQVAPFTRAMEAGLKAVGIEGGFAAVFPESGDGRLHNARYRAIPKTLEVLADALSRRAGRPFSAGAPRGWKTAEHHRWVFAPGADDAPTPMPDLGFVDAVRDPSQVDNAPRASRRRPRKTVAATDDSNSEGGGSALQHHAPALHVDVARSFMDVLPLDLLDDVEAILKAGPGAERREIQDARGGKSAQWAQLDRIGQRVFDAPEGFARYFPQMGHGAQTRVIGNPASYVALATALAEKLERSVTVGPVVAFRAAGDRRITLVTAGASQVVVGPGATRRAEPQSEQATAAQAPAPTPKTEAAADAESLTFLDLRKGDAPFYQMYRD